MKDWQTSTTVWLTVHLILFITLSQFSWHVLILCNKLMNPNGIIIIEYRLYYISGPKKNVSCWCMLLFQLTSPPSALRQHINMER